LTIKDWGAGKTRDNCAAINPVTEAHEAFFADEKTQRAQNLVLAAEIAELTRQEHVLCALPGDPSLNPLAQCLRSTHGNTYKNPTLSIYKHPTAIKL
jgi:hypothetical protein